MFPTIVIVFLIVLQSNNDFGEVNRTNPTIYTNI
jgi:hypothetical protein